VTNYIAGKSIIVTGAGSGFGRLVSEKAAALGGNITCLDINADRLSETLELIEKTNGTAQIITANVTKPEEMKRAAAKAIKAYGQVDVILNNAGIMPLAFYSDHELAIEKWHQCIDVNIKGVVNGIACVFDHMMARGEGHVINMSSIFGNYPVEGSNVYGATKAAVNFLSESLRVEANGKIKVTIVKPTGVLTTGLVGGIVNAEAAVGIAGHKGESHGALMGEIMAGSVDPERLNPQSPKYMNLDPNYVADQIIHAMNQPKGVSVGDITIRATGDHYIL